jgi:hypothetical protein
MKSLMEIYADSHLRFLENQVRADIANRRFLGWLFLTLFCLAGFAHFLAVKKELVPFQGSLSFFAVEAVLIAASILVFVQMRQWQNFLKQNNTISTKLQGDENMTTGKAIAWAFAALIGIFLIAWMVQGNDFFIYKVFGSKYEQTRHEIFKTSQSYVDGKVQELQQNMLEYQKGSPEVKAMLKTVIIRESAKVDENFIPSDLRAFINGLKNQSAQPMSFK